MKKRVIKNIGRLVTGDIEHPLARADCIGIEGSRITYVGPEEGLGPGGEQDVIDAGGMTALPGLIDTHIHPAIGEYSPMQDISGYIGNYLHGGTTSMISNGEVLIPGQPRDRESIKALAIFAAKCYQNHRPAGVKVQGGTLLLGDGFTEADFARYQEKG